MIANGGNARPRTPHHQAIGMGPTSISPLTPGILAYPAMAPPGGRSPPSLSGSTDQQPPSTNFAHVLTGARTPAADQEPYGGVDGIDDLGEECDSPYTGEDAPDFEDGLYSDTVLDSSNYEIEQIKLINETARDESLPEIVHYIMKIGHFSDIVKARLIASASTYQGKNFVYSNLGNKRELRMMQDDFWYTQKLLRIGLTTYDRNVDYLTVGSLIESNFNARVQRSKNALNLRQLNSRTSENISESRVRPSEDERRVRSRIPFLGDRFG